MFSSLADGAWGDRKPITVELVALGNQQLGGEPESAFLACCFLDSNSNHLASRAFFICQLQSLLTIHIFSRVSLSIRMERNEEDGGLGGSVYFRRRSWSLHRQPSDSFQARQNKLLIALSRRVHNITISEATILLL